MGLSTIALCLCNSPYNARKQNPTSPFLHGLKPLVTERRIFRLPATFSGMSHTQTLTTNSLPVTPCNAPLKPKNAQNLHPAFLQLATSAILFVGFSARACTPAPGRIPIVPVSTSQTVQEERIVSNDDNYDSSFEVNSDNVVVGKSDIVADMEDNDLKAAFESWKSKTYALTVPLRIVALRGSVPPSWVKDFTQVQGRKLKLQSEFRGRLEDIFSDLCTAFSKGNPGSKSAVTADVVTIGDSWLSLAIKKGIIEPILGVEGQDWFKDLSDKWKVYLCRNSEGELDSNGVVWAAPYRWGSMVIAYKKSKFKGRNMAPIEDWKDLWRPELAGKISMVDSPREVIGAVLKYMGASYNTNDIDLQVTGGKNSTLQNLILLQKQVRLFDSIHYLKAFGVGDVWVAVGWSSDVIPAAKRMSNVAVIVPKSGASLWADLWAIPGATKFSTNRIGGRVRGASPLIHQWIEFCLQAARALPFKQEVIPGASPFTLEDKIEGSPEFNKGKPKLDTNLIAGVPPPEILERCEFLEPLSEAALKDYQWLVANMNKPGHGLMWEHITAMVQTFGLNPHLR